ncbi:MAG: hypothetical protein IPL65_17575 [Lewinellaceae bacterium]|nr:hypothetical protein [Lewinellaceae bacterium]
MKKILFSALLLCFVAYNNQAQIVLKADQLIRASDWNNITSLLNGQAYGTASVIDEDGIVYKVTGAKPLDPTDAVSWRPPVIPPLSETPDNPGSNNQDIKPNKKKPKPIDPGCDTCTLLFVSNDIQKEVMIKLEYIFSQYK